MSLLTLITRFEKLKIKAEEMSQWEKGVMAVQPALSAKPTGTLIVFKFKKSFLTYDIYINI